MEETLANMPHTDDLLEFQLAARMALGFSSEGMSLGFFKGGLRVRVELRA